MGETQTLKTFSGQYFGEETMSGGYVDGVWRTRCAYGLVCERWPLCRYYHPPSERKHLTHEAYKQEDSFYAASKQNYERREAIERYNRDVERAEYSCPEAPVEELNAV